MLSKNVLSPNFCEMSRFFSKTILLGVILLFPLIRIIPQNNIQVGKWRTHFSYNQGEQVAVGNNEVYCIASGNMFSYNKKSNTLNPLGKMEGLSDNQISAIRWSKSTNYLLIGYDNGNIDVLENQKITNIPDIKNKLNLSGKRINHIYVHGDNAYLSCGFGIVCFNLQKKEFRDTYYIGPNGTQIEVIDFCEGNETFYALTSDGIYTGNVDDPNLINFASWTKLNTSFFAEASIKNIEFFENNLYVLIENNEGESNIFYDERNWKNLPYSLNEDARYKDIQVSNENLIVIERWNVIAFDKNLDEKAMVSSSYASNAIMDDNNVFWISDRKSGLVRHTGNKLTTLRPSGPINNKSFRLTTTRKGLYITAGAVTPGWNNSYTPGVIHKFLDNTWSAMVFPDSIKDLAKIKFDPRNNEHYFVSSWSRGIIEVINNEIVNIFAGHNALSSVVGSDSFNTRAYGLDFDPDGNLYVTTSNDQLPISVKTTDNKWFNYDYKAKIGHASIGEILISTSGYKWVIIPRGIGMFVFDDNGTLDNESDDEYKLFSVKNAENKFISDNIYDIAEDKDNNIWLGTEKGPVVYYNPGNIFANDGSFYASQILIARENDSLNRADALLSEEAISTLEIDGANRKWFGTKHSGAYLMSENAKEEIHHFTTENSGLPSNHIYDIAIHPTTGEVFFATPEGLVSYRERATEPNDFFKDVYVFPNPVRENYNGDIIVTGLIGDVNVKITDISGNIVYETTSLGGQAVWNGKNFSGRRVSTGIYLVFCTNEDGSQTHVTKLLFIN